MIGPASDRDIAGILRLAQRLWSESPVLRGLRLDPERAATIAYRLVATGTLLVAEDNETGEPVGFLAFTVDADDWTGLPCAAERALYVVPEARGQALAGDLIACAVAHARDRGALWFTAGASLGLPTDAVGRAYAGAGFVRTGEVYRMSLAAVPATA